MSEGGNCLTGGDRCQEFRAGSGPSKWPRGQGYTCQVHEIHFLFLTACNNVRSDVIGHRTSPPNARFSEFIFTLTICISEVSILAKEKCPR